MKYREKINALIDELYKEGVSVLVVATSSPLTDDGFYRVASPETKIEDIVLNDLLSGMAKASVAVRERIKEVENEEYENTLATEYDTDDDHDYHHECEYCGGDHSNFLCNEVKRFDDLDCLNCGNSFFFRSGNCTECGYQQY